jgi:hypothetical protein
LSDESVLEHRLEQLEAILERLRRDLAATRCELLNG